MSLCVILKICDWKTVFLISKQLFTDDSLMLRFYSLTKDHVEKIKHYLNKQHKNKKFTSKIEEDSSLSFLDITISRENNKFVTSVYRGASFSSIFTNFESSMHKRRLIDFIEVLRELSSGN